MFFSLHRTWILFPASIFNHIFSFRKSDTFFWPSWAPGSYIIHRYNASKALTHINLLNLKKTHLKKHFKNNYCIPFIFPILWKYEIQFHENGWLKHLSKYAKIYAVFTNLAIGKNVSISLFKCRSDHYHPFPEQPSAGFAEYLCMRYVYILLLFKLLQNIVYH